MRAPTCQAPARRSPRLRRNARGLRRFVPLLHFRWVTRVAATEFVNRRSRAGSSLEQPSFPTIREIAVRIIFQSREIASFTFRRLKETLRCFDKAVGFSKSRSSTLVSQEVGKHCYHLAPTTLPSLRLRMSHNGSRYTRARARLDVLFTVPLTHLHGTKSAAQA